MKNRILPLVCLLLLCVALLQPFAASAAPLDIGAKVNLTVHYEHGEKQFAGQSVVLYRVAEAFPDGTYALVEPFASYPVNIYDITDEAQWKTVAKTLSAYITADGLQPHGEQTTDAAGVAHFTGLKTGMYLVREVVAEEKEGLYVFDDFLLYMPFPQPDGTYDYHAVARPKCVSQVPRTQYTVTKLWQDAGYQSARPKSVTVDIYKDGVLETTQILNSENNWTYTWYVTGKDTGKWTVTERNVSKAYKVTVQKAGGTFTIINIRTPQPSIPQTGDTFAPLPWILAMTISGMALLLLGLYSRRRR